MDIDYKLDFVHDIAGKNVVEMYEKELFNYIVNDQSFWDAIIKERNEMRFKLIETKKEQNPIIEGEF